MIRSILKFLLPIVVLLAFVASGYYLSQQRKEPEPEPPEESALIVDTELAVAVSERVAIITHGTVKASETYSLRTEVGGRVLELHPKLERGEVVPAGALLLKLDKREFEASVRELSAQVSRARSDYQLEKGRGRTAGREWKLLGQSVPSDDAGKNLALRKPQLKSARAALAGARGTLERARLNVERTEIRAPFQGLVLSETVAKDQVVSPQAALATLVRTDIFYVEVSVPMGDLGWIDIPGPLSAIDTRGSNVTVIQDLGAERKVERAGRVLRLVGEVDPVGRMARLLIEVSDPLGLNSKAQPGDGSDLPLMLGAYVRVEIAGREVNNVVSLPRTAFRDGEFVWLVDSENRLKINRVKVLWRKRDAVLVKSGLSAGERYVTSRIGTPVTGMRLEVAKPESADDGDSVSATEVSE